MTKRLVIYETAEGKCPFTEWLTGLKDKRARGIIRARLERVQLGNLGDCRNVGSGVFELRVFFGPGYRVYFGQDGESLVVLLCGGDKSSQQRDIEKAKAFWEDYKNAD